MQAPQEFPPDVCSMYAGVGAAGHAWRRSRSLRLQLGASSPGVAAHPTPRARYSRRGRSRVRLRTLPRTLPLPWPAHNGKRKSLNPGVAVRAASRALGRQESRHEILEVRGGEFCFTVPMPSPRSQAPMGWENRLSQTTTGYNAVWSRLAINRKTSARIPGSASTTARWMAGSRWDSMNSRTTASNTCRERCLLSLRSLTGRRCFL